MTEAQFEAKFCQDLKDAYGAMCLKSDKANITGFPDRTIIMPDGLTIFIEFKKSKDAEYQPLQKAQLDKLKKLGQVVFVCYPENRNEVWAAIERWY